LSIKFEGELSYTHYIIPAGNYNIRSLILYLSTLLPDLTFSFSSISNKITISHSSLDFYLGGTIYEVLGFEKDVYYESYLSTLELPYPCNFNGDQLLQISIDNINTMNVNLFSKYSNSSIIGCIPVSPELPIISFNNSTPTTLPVQNIDYLDISIKNTKNEYVDFNGCHWSMILFISNNVPRDKFAFVNTFHKIIQTGKFSHARHPK
jgi:hypothetical protein